ncbi:MAG: UDP-N-acetylmuramate dehydrogenase [Firmicutes bacterium]|nr:UDP-N-acetylmuramate dehydrogenase [Bacillota bacterium]
MNPIAITEALQKLVKAQVKADAPLKPYTTWKIGGPADWLVTPANAEELRRVLALCREAELPWMVMGNGSNLLVGDKGVRGVVIRLGEDFSRMTWQDDRVEAYAGLLLRDLARKAADLGFTGLEYVHGIPGSVGGGIRMNCGAYGGNLSTCVTSVKALTYDGEEVELGRDQIDFAYRNSSLFQLDAVITSVCLRLVPGDKEEIQALMAEFQHRREQAQPLEYPSCGSVFKNPPGDHAGWIVERNELRGTRIGGVQISEKHGNFIVNRWDGSADDARRLIEWTQEKVMELEQIRLEPEVRFVGEFI